MTTSLDKTAAPAHGPGPLTAHPTGRPGPAHPGRWVAAGLAGSLVVCTGLLALGQMTSTTRSSTRDFTGPVTAVVAESGTGDLEVLVVPGSTGARVTTRLSGRGGRPVATAALDGGTLRLTADCSGGTWYVPCSVRHEVQVPPGTSVRVDASTGDAALSGALSEVTARMSTGDLSWEDAAGGRLDATTRTGDLTVEGAVATLELRTNTGDIGAELTAAPVSVTAQANTGDITVSVPDDGTQYATDIATRAGDVTGAVPADTVDGRPMTVRTTTGDVAVVAGTR
ncbi:hypothetical protein NUM3379_24780 [Kineococcus sp. NUM-3379]